MTIPQASDSSPSNLLESPELSTQQSRKRMRSLSMQSDSGASSSSVKRSVADNPSNDIPVRSPRTDQLSTPPLTDPNNHDIDAYMAEQGEADIPTVMGPPASQINPTVSMLSRGDKLSMVQTGKSRRMEVGETWYLVARVWYKRWLKACTGEVDKEGPITEQDIVPVDNSSVLDGYGNLLPSLAEGVDVEYVPQEIWDLFVNWYGTPSHPLSRRVIARGLSKLPALELRPLRLKVFRLVKSSVNSTTPHPWLTISAGETISKLCTELAGKVDQGGETRPYRIWKVGISFEEVSEIEFLGSQLSASDAKIIEGSDKTLEEEGIESDDAFIVEFKQTEGWIVEVPKPVQTPSTIEAPRPLFSSNEGFFNKMSSTFSPASSVAPYKSSLYDGFGSSSKTTSTALTLSNKSISKTLEPGTLGLGNMGNTCFMNSALQCLAHTKELTDYFLSGVFEDELNRDNPLGMGGAIAEAFGSLLQRVWAETGPSTSYSPREFKSQLQRFAPQFSGYQQHDSQELVAFLLDGLHEDLNRVLKKPYVEKPDWEGGGDVEMVKLAQKSWEGYMMRNDSVIVDLFQGQYQSTLVCPECQKVSITFDPFMYLTLPLPVQKKWKHSIYYIPWDLEKPHVKVPVEISRDASFKDLRILLGRWMGAPPENLLTMEIFSHRFYKTLDDNVPVGDMGDNDTIVCFELPCNARQSRTYKKQPEDPIIIPVYLCDARTPIRSSYFTNSRSSTPSLFGYPMVIAIERDQATDVNTMYDIVATRLQRWTAHARDLFAWEVGGPSRINEVPIHINGFPPMESVTEITEDGQVVTVETVPPEGDIVDEKDMIVDEEHDELESSEDSEPRRVGVKKDIFNLRLQVNHKDLGTAYNAYASNNRWESWDNRTDDASTEPILLRGDDAFYCEFEEDKKAYYFGDSPRHEHALWDNWEVFAHPEYEESKKASAEKRHKGISLRDCLDEFTKQEQLGEDDLWYCPQCKKHQQATKKFDLWKVPDILVVHLKRFSNNRTLRDKIDTHIDFPIEGLDLSDMAGERNVAKKLVDEGVDIKELKLENLDEPLVYDLFGVDEHIGGLGGGHYRAYASNHLTGKWYHFDDSYVTPARASDSVNANAYLLFYRRRTKSSLGGKSFQKVQKAKLQPKVEVKEEPIVIIDTQLPTPPNDTADFTNTDRLPFFSELSSDLRLRNSDSWNLRSSGSNGGSSVPSPPTDDPPDFEDYRNDPLVSYNDPLVLSAQRYDFPDPSSKASPSSSNEADIDLDTDLDHEDWDSPMNKFRVGVREVSSGSGRSPEWDPVSIRASPSYSESSDLDPFSDANMQKLGDDEVMDRKHAHEKTD
ncbi:hypothetical protein GALMADRAFT_241045 [Galerina marginata CBS 339.88]|uniref:ubiquitinyl hydrolase 1 n=1 Tax=Galerina marginata (strain CBS 339.88) TaxID=685588 RepID=A0A067TE86_GALM3|nr:hypothetical protein GALMADRAFT_241045 [Galerina marginata CBS 339.88]